jgi:hypothetical protein
MDEKEHVRSATRGLIIAHICLGLAGGAAVTLFGLLAYTQAYPLVVWVPTIALGVVTLGALVLLRVDAAARKKRGE